MAGQSLGKFLNLQRFSALEFIEKNAQSAMQIGALKSHLVKILTYKILIRLEALLCRTVTQYSSWY